jgi:hypothetical protein
MLNFITNLLKTPRRVHPSGLSQNIKTESIVSHLSNGNILLQQAKYTTHQDILNMKNNIFSYFSK